MADRKLYDEKTKTGWKRVKGKWQYFQDGIVADTGFKGAQETSRKWIKDTTKKAKDIRQQAIEREESYVPQVMSTHKTPITTALTEEVLPKTWDLTKRGAKNLKNAVFDIPKIGQGSGEFNDKGKELSVFELRRQNEKYRNQLETESLEEIELPDGGDFYSLALMDSFKSEPNSDFTKMLEGVDTSNFNVYQGLNFKNAVNETYWLTEGANGATFSKQTKENSYTNIAKNLKSSQTGGSQQATSLEKGAGLEPNPVNNYIAPVISKTNTAIDPATANLPAQAQTRKDEVAKEEPRVTQWYDLEGEDGGAAAKALWKQNNQPEQVKIDPIEFKDPVQSDLLFRDQRMETGINPLRNA